MAFIYMHLLQDTQTEVTPEWCTAQAGWEGAAGGVIAAMTELCAEGHQPCALLVGQYMGQYIYNLISVSSFEE